jgi:lactate dehydrogenase-like 2-hydroxyacid dehydrogenase
MPHTNKKLAPLGVDIPELEGRYVELGEYTVAFETYRADVDPAEFFRGLPDDRCQCPHWGVVGKGRIGFRFADRTETYSAGDAYYAPPGHTPVLSEDSEVVEFSPTEALGATMAVVQANLAAAAEASA